MSADRIGTVSDGLVWIDEDGREKCRLSIQPHKDGGVTINVSYGNALSSFPLMPVHAEHFANILLDDGEDKASRRMIEGMSR